MDDEASGVGAAAPDQAATAVPSAAIESAARADARRVPSRRGSADTPRMRRSSR
jgi:hypothetical protein